DGKGLNLTYAVRDGVVSHCGEHFQQTSRPETQEKELTAIKTRQLAPLTYEGCVVRMADKIAYLGRDIEDAISTNLITIKDVPDTIKSNLGSTNGEIIDTLVMDVVNTSIGNDAIAFSDARYSLFCHLKDFNYDHIYNHPSLKRSDKAIDNLIQHLHAHLIGQFKKYGDDAKAYKQSIFQVDYRFWTFYSKRKAHYTDDIQRQRCIIDFMAGMTDPYALEAAEEVIFPRTVALR
ncbi:phosphohydrolase, partial [bacterium]|nr:phosphohydrolase [bacterium]